MRCTFDGGSNRAMLTSASCRITSLGFDVVHSGFCWPVWRSMKGHDSTSASNWSNFLLCYQLKQCEIVPRPLVLSFLLSPLPLQRFQRTGPFFGLVFYCKTNEGLGEQHCLLVTFSTLVLFFFVCLWSFLFIFFLSAGEDIFWRPALGKALECH